MINKLLIPVLILPKNKVDFNKINLFIIINFANINTVTKFTFYCLFFINYQVPRSSDTHRSLRAFNLI